MYLLELNTV